MNRIKGRLVVGGLFGLAVIVALLLYTDVRDLSEKILAFPYLTVFPILGLTLFNYSLRWVKWQYYLKVIGINNLSALDSAAVWVGGCVLALSPGKIAEFLKAAVVGSLTGTPVSRCLPIVVAERVTDGLAMMVLAAIGLGGMLFSAMSNSQPALRYLPAYFTLLGLIVAGVVLIQIKPLFEWILRHLYRVPVIGRFARQLDEVYRSSSILFGPVSLMVGVGIGVVSWAGECIGFYLILRGLGIPNSWLLLWQALFILAAATIIGGVSGLPGGLGAAEISVASMVQVIVLQHSDAGLAGSAALLVRAFTLWFGVVLGLCVAFAFRDTLFRGQAGDAWRTARTEPVP